MPVSIDEFESGERLQQSVSVLLHPPVVERVEKREDVLARRLDPVDRLSEEFA